MKRKHLPLGTIFTYVGNDHVFVVEPTTGATRPHHSFGHVTPSCKATAGICWEDDVIVLVAGNGPMEALDADTRADTTPGGRVDAAVGEPAGVSGVPAGDPQAADPRYWGDNYTKKSTPQPVGDSGVKPMDSASSAESDPTNPAHYRAFSIEPIDAIESWGLNFRLANVVKYVARAGRKPADGDLVKGVPGNLGSVDVGSVERGRSITTARRRDLSKALRYLCREINALDGRASWEPPEIHPAKSGRNSTPTLLEPGDSRVGGKAGRNA